MIAHYMKMPAVKVLDIMHRGIENRGRKAAEEEYEPKIVSLEKDVSGLQTNNAGLTDKLVLAYKSAVKLDSVIVEECGTTREVMQNRPDGTKAGQGKALKEYRLTDVLGGIWTTK